jgi:hypothetical protein
MKKQSIGIIMLIFGIITTFYGFSSFDGLQMFVGGLITYFGSQLYNSKSIPGQNKKQIQAEKFEVSDDMIMRLAKRLGNRLSVDELTTQTSLNREQAQERLEKLHQKGICQINLEDVAEKGNVYYYF